MVISKELSEALIKEGVEFSPNAFDFVESIKNWLLLTKAKNSTDTKEELEMIENDNLNSDDETKKIKTALENNSNIVLDNDQKCDDYKSAEKKLKRLKFFIEFVLTNCHNSSMIISFTFDLISTILIIAQDLSSIPFASFPSSCFPSPSLFASFFSLHDFSSFSSSPTSASSSPPFSSSFSSSSSSASSTSFSISSSSSFPSSSSSFSSSSSSLSASSSSFSASSSSFVSSSSSFSLSSSSFFSSFSFPPSSPSSCATTPYNSSSLTSVCYPPPPDFSFSKLALVRALHLEEFFVALATIGKPKEAYVAFISTITANIHTHLKILVLKPLAMSVEKITSKRVRFLLQVLPTVLQKFVTNRSIQNEYDDYRNEEGEEDEHYNNVVEVIPEIGDKNKPEKKKKQKKENLQLWDITDSDNLAVLCVFLDMICKGSKDTQEDDNYNVGPPSIASFGFAIIFHYTILMTDKHFILDVETSDTNLRKEKSEGERGREENDDGRAAGGGEGKAAGEVIDSCANYNNDFKKSAQNENEIKIHDNAHNKYDCKVDKEKKGAVLFNLPINMWVEKPNNIKNKKTKKEIILEYLNFILSRICAIHPDINGVFDNINIIKPVDDMGGGGDLEISPLSVACAVYLYTCKKCASSSLPLVYSSYRYINMMLRSAYVFLIAANSTSSILNFFSMKTKKRPLVSEYVLRRALLNKLRNIIFTASVFFSRLRFDSPNIYNSIHSFSWQPVLFFSAFLDLLASSPELSTYQRHILFEYFKWVSSFFSYKAKFDLYIHILEACKFDTACGALLIIFKEEWWRCVKEIYMDPLFTYQKQVSSFRENEDVLVHQENNKNENNNINNNDLNNEKNEDNYFCNTLEKKIINENTKLIIDGEKKEEKDSSILIANLNNNNKNTKKNDLKKFTDMTTARDLDKIKWYGGVLIRVMKFCLSGKCMVEDGMDILTCSLNWLKLVLMSQELVYFHHILLSVNKCNIKALLDGVAKQIDIEMSILNKKLKTANTGGEIFVGEAGRSENTDNIISCMEKQITQGDVRRVGSKHVLKGVDVKLNRLYLVSNVLSQVRLIIDKIKI